MHAIVTSFGPNLVNGRPSSDNTELNISRQPIIRRDCINHELLAGGELMIKVISGTLIVSEIIIYKVDIIEL
jgi:hypothetical protein